MKSIKDLLKRFEALDVNLHNIDLWKRLIYSNMSDFKPLMQELLDGNLDIEDTRVILPTNITRFNNPYQAKDRLISDDNPQVLMTNILKRLFPNTTKGEVIREAVVSVKNIDDYKHIIARAYQRLTGRTLTENQIERIVPEIDRYVTLQINVDNMNVKDVKATQIKYANALTPKKLNARL